MERLTEWLPAGTGANVKYPDDADAVEKSACRQKAFDRLAVYEDTGMEPEDIKELSELKTSLTAAKQNMLNDYLGLGSVARLRELAEADNKGLVRILPYSVLAYKIYTKRNRHGNVHRRIVECINYGFPESEIGKTVFLTREADEAALKAGDHR